MGTGRMVYLSVYCMEEEREWVKHAAKLRGLSMAEYVKRAVNAALIRDGVDAYLFAEKDEPR